MSRMRLSISKWTSLLILSIVLPAGALCGEKPDYDKAHWDPIHFKPQIDKATNEQCLVCHKEVLDTKPLDQSPAGVKSSDALAWYQTLDTYQGAQDTFHRRHLVTPMAVRLMDMKCTTCHQGSDPREQAPIPPVSAGAGFTLRKKVDPKTCLMCHGRFPHETMGLPDSWAKVGDLFGNNCMTCHAAIRTTRHNVNFLKPQAIEEDGKLSGDSCYGCHGGRQWYRISFPYPRHPWPGMASEKPAWAKDRLTESEARFLQYMKAPSQSSGEIKPK